MFMLMDAMKFNDVEVLLRERGELEKFEKESGEILGRAMVTFGEVPEDLKGDVLKGYNKEDVYVFNCSFDFFDSYLGIAMDKRSLRPVGNIWTTEQMEGSDKPTQDWIEFFVRILVEHVVENKDGSGIPLYIFLNNDAELVIEPTI